VVKRIISDFSNLKPNEVYKKGFLLPIIEAVDFLSPEPYQTLFKQINSDCGLPKEYYSAFYLKVIQQFVEFVQLFPTRFSGPLGSIINSSLARATLALRSFRDEYEQMDPVRAYALFTAALFQSISTVLTHQRVVLTTEEGEFIENWNPFTGSIVGRAKYYRILPIGLVNQHLDYPSRYLFARQLMPVKGYQWIAGDLEVLADWFDALRDPGGERGSFAHILSHLKRDELFALESLLAQPPIQQKWSIATEHGEAFYHWLREGIDQEKIAINTSDAGLHIVREGLFLEKEKLFKQFVESYPHQVSASVTYKQFAHFVGIGEKGGGGLMNVRYLLQSGQYQARTRSLGSPIGAKQQSLMDGMLLADPGRIFVNSQVPAVSPLMRSIQARGLSYRDLPTLTKIDQLKKTPSLTSGRNK